MLTVDQFIEYFLTTFETSKLSLDPQDHGNYYKGSLIGSKYGVTGDALEKHTNHIVTKEQMANLSLEEASSIAKENYYIQPKINLLDWNTITASLLDFGWGSGTKTAIKVFQNFIHTPADGIIGQNTEKTFKERLSSLGEEALSNQFYERRKSFLLSLNQPKFIKGWLRRLDTMKYNSPIWG